MNILDFAAIAFDFSLHDHRFVIVATERFHEANSMLSISPVATVPAKLANMH